MLNNLDKYNVVLGSNSPRRRELLNDMGVTFRVEAIKGIDETYPANLPVEEIPVYLARIKAEGHPLQPNELLITADTVVVLDDAVLGKPTGDADAHRMLRALSGLKCLFKSVGFPHPAISARVQVIIIFVYAVVIVS